MELVTEVFKRPRRGAAVRYCTASKNGIALLCIKHLGGNIMPNHSHQRAAEFHELAAHAHRVAAVHHGKEDHLTGHEHSRLALEHATKAFHLSEEAHEKSGKSAGKS
jgi:hypothetical protein